jgi:hypothetical protein
MFLEHVMATFEQYADIAIAVYFDKDAEHQVGGWVVRKWMAGTLLGNGFQGGIYESDDEVVCGFKGTNPKGVTIVADLLADLKLTLGFLPSQANSAYDMVKAAVTIAQGKQVSVVGHSLGGALGQVIGVWLDVPFVTFNAPGMKAQVKLANFNFLQPVNMVRTIRAKSTGEAEGVNFRIKGDIVGGFGAHIGPVIEFANPGTGGTHGKETCRTAIQQSEYRWQSLADLEVAGVI